MSELCKKCSEDRFWTPIAVNTYDSYLQKLIIKTTDIEKTYELRRNIAYNLQYLEYLIKTLNELSLMTVITTQTYKTIIITGMGIIEAIFYYALRSKNYHKENVWQLIKVVPGNQYKSLEDVLRIDNVIYKKLDMPIEEEMTFDSMIKKVEAKKILGGDHKIYEKINYLRKLRNKVHLHLIEQKLDTDWNNFNKKEKDIMLDVLRNIMCSNLFNLNNQEIKIFDFMIVENQEQATSNP